MEIHTPALLFPVVSLFFIAFTTRFLGLAAVSRQLFQRLIQEKANDDDSSATEAQLKNLRGRIQLLRGTQLMGLLTLLGAALSMAAIYGGNQAAGASLFFVSISTLITSVLISVVEVFQSAGAIEIEFKQHKIGD